MIKITPYKISTQNIQIQKNEEKPQSSTSFCSAQTANQTQVEPPIEVSGNNPWDNPWENPLHSFRQNSWKNIGQFFGGASIPYPIPPNLSVVKLQETFLAPPWITDPTILKALGYLNDLEFSKKDIKCVQSQGAILPFSSGKDAVNFIKSANTRIKFGTLPSADINAQYDYENNFIKINDAYKNTKNPSEILAIAEAILHEVGHAKDWDEKSSIQEEIDCLALNALAHKSFNKKFPNVFNNADSLIMKNGATISADLLLDKDPRKSGLTERLKQKYGFLPIGDFNHPPSDLAFDVKTTHY